MFDAIKDLFNLLIPPLDADPAHQYRWRLTIAALMMGVIIALFSHIALACGRIPYLFSGFATSAALKESADAQAQSLNLANAKMDRILQRETKRAILENRGKECMAITAKNWSARDYALANLQDALNDWRSQTGGDYRLPGCDELGN